MKKLMLPLAFVLASSVVCAADRTLERDEHYVVDSSAADYQEKLAEIASCATFYLDYGSVVEFNLDEAVDLTLNTRFTACWGSQNRSGKLIKKGKGTLRFETAKVSSNDYYLDIDVRAGALYLPQTNKLGLQYSNRVNVESGAIFWAQAGASSASNQAATYWFDELTGSGDVYGWSSLKINKDCEFGGNLHITGPVFALGHLTLSGTNSEFTYVIQCDNTLKDGVVTQHGIAELASPEAYRTSGAAIDFNTLNGGGEIRLTGTTETQWTYPNRVDVRANGAAARSDAVLNAGPVVSAGTVGNFDWTGGWRFSYGGYDYPTGIPGVWYFTLDGDNVEYPAICSGTILDTLNKGDALRYVWAIRKRGTGIWRIEANSGSNWSGPLFVENGVLQYDTIADAGANCALGTAANLYKPTWTNIYESLGYAIGVGSADEPSWKGLLECTAATAVSMKTRPVRVLGTGGFKAEAGTVDWSDISADNANATLVLSGSNGGDNVVRNLDDGDGKLSVLKEGTGTWRIADRAAITGDIAVNGGKLKLLNPLGLDYQYYRFIVKGNGFSDDRYRSYWPENGGGWPSSAAESCIVSFFHINIFDENGQPIMTEDNSSCTGTVTADARTLAPGQIEYDGTYKTGMSGQFYAQIKNVFNNRCNSSGGLNSPKAKFDIGDSTTWAACVWRVPENAKRVYYCDYASTDALTETKGGRTCTAFELQGSYDGLNWETAYEKHDVPCQGAWAWASNGAQMNHEGDVALNCTKNPHPGFGCSGTVQKALDHYLDGVGTLSVASGATLEVKGEITFSSLRLDAVNGAGTFDGVTFAENGTVDLVGGKTGVPATFVNSPSVTNVANWTVTRDGRPSCYRIRPTDSGFDVLPPGLMMIFR